MQFTSKPFPVGPRQSCRCVNPAFKRLQDTIPNIKRQLGRPASWIARCSMLLIHDPDLTRYPTEIIVSRSYTNSGSSGDRPRECLISSTNPLLNPVNLVNPVKTSTRSTCSTRLRLQRHGDAFGFPGMELRHEVHLQRSRQLRCRAEREVHVLPEHLRYIRTRHLHPPRKIRLRHSQLLHSQEYPPQKSRADVVDSPHSKIRSAPVEYAAEHPTVWLFAALPQNRYMMRRTYGTYFNLLVKSCQVRPCADFAPQIKQAPSARRKGLHAAAVQPLLA